MTRKEVGTRNLNKVLQELINPPSGSKAEIVYGGVTLRVGDGRKAFAFAPGVAALLAWSKSIPHKRIA